MPTNSEIRTQITNQLIDAIESGTLPWRRQFIADPNAGLATSLSTGKKYSGINSLLLSLASLQKNYTSKFWGTFSAVKFVGGHVRRGEKATRVVLFNPIKKTKTDKDGNEKTETYLVYKQFSVFNAEQCEGLDEYQIGFARSNVELSGGSDEADRIIESTGAKFEFGGNQAAYYPSLDKIVLPFRHQFESVEAYYETAFHELGHWSHHPERMSPPKRSRDEEYAYHELVVEISACYLMSACNLPLDCSNHAAYLESWASALRKDSRFIFTASALASRTADFILSFNQSVKVEAEEAIPF